MWRKWVWIGAALAVGGGCLRREETITVNPDRSVRVDLKYEGHLKDFETADALPGAESGWEVEDKTTVEENGEVTRLLTSRRDFAAGEDLPASFAPENDPDAGLYTAFPTRVYTEKRDDGEYLYFRRIYTPRPWAYAEFWTDEFFDDDHKKLADKPVEQLTRDERIQLISTLAGIELFKQLEFAQEALRATDPELRPEAWLAARAAVIAEAKEIDWGVLVDRVEHLDPARRDEQVEREAERVQRESYQLLRQTLREKAGYGKSELAGFDAAYRQAEKRYTITSETGGQNFMIRLKLPGELIAHNADKIDGDYLVWDFSGRAFRDRPFELIAVSKLEKEAR